MTLDPSIVSMPRLRSALGQDYVYVSALDTQRHFDSELVIGAFLVHLLASAVSAAMTEFAKQAGRAAWPGVLALFHKLKQSDLPDHNSQVEGIKSSDEALKSLGAEFSESEAEDFVAFTRDELERSLVARQFPEPKAKRLAREIAAIVRERMPDAR